MTGTFSTEMKSYFGADDGAFTSFTDVEIRKGTFNVKAIIRDLLIERLGYDNIPRAGVSNNQDIEFAVCPRSKIYNASSVNIPCKFSKQDKDEMTIYFNRVQMSSYQDGDYWYVYFTENSNVPVIGILSETKWNDLFFIDAADELQEPDENNENELSYMLSAEDMDISEVIPPEPNTVIRMCADKTRKSISAGESAVKAYNRKAKGNMGEAIVMELERRRLLSINRPDLIPKIAHVANYKDGLGYDIISMDVDSNGNELEIYIEVKTTAGGVDMPFYISRNELEVSRNLKELYYIYRVFNLKENVNNVSYYKLNGAIDESCDLVAMNYMATPKAASEDE